MIVFYTGTPGSGKSLHAAHDIRYQLNKPRGEDAPVIGNFPINETIVRRPQAYHYVPNAELTPQWLCDFADDFWKHTKRRFSEDYLLVVLDECQLLFNSRTWHDKGAKGKQDSRLDWLSFFSQHRKYGYKVILVAQSAKMVDNQFRMLCDYEVNHRKVQHMGFFGACISALFLNRLFMRVKYLFQSSERLGMQMYVAHGKDMRMYDSYAKFKKKPTSDEKKG